MTGAASHSRSSSRGVWRKSGDVLLQVDADAAEEAPLPLLTFGSSVSVGV